MKKPGILPTTLSKHLTEPNAKLGAQARVTQPGQAHFAEPTMRFTCRECVFWQHSKGDYRVVNGKWRGLIKPSPCAKFTQLNQGKRGALVPDDAQACRHFEFNQTPPERFYKR